MAEERIRPGDWVTHPNWDEDYISPAVVIDPPQYSYTHENSRLIFIQREHYTGWVREGFYRVVKQPPMPEPRDMRAPGSPQGSRCGREG